MTNDNGVARQVKKIVSFIRKGKPIRNEVIVGPLALRPEDASIESEWYFIFVHEGQGEARITALGADEQDLADLIRTKLIQALRIAKFVAHDFADELAVGQMAEALWPSEKTRRIHERLKTEFADRLTDERLDLGVDSLMKERALTDAEIILFGLDAKEAENIFAMEMDSEAGQSTVYFRKVEVDVDGELVPVVQPYSPP